MKLHFLTSNLANYIDILNQPIADYIISEAEFSKSNYEREEIQPLNKDDICFIDECEIEGDDDVCFYRSVDNATFFISDDEETAVPVLEQNVGKRRIESDSESDSKFAIPNSDEGDHKIEKNKIVIPDAMRQFYGTDNYE